MLERVKEIRERIRDDRVHYRDSILTLRESHIVMNALQALEAYEKENSELRHRAEVAERQAILLSKWLAKKTRKDYPWRAWFDAAQKQAEKELAEGK